MVAATEEAMRVAVISRREAIALVVEHHYMHRRPPISFAFGLIDDYRRQWIIRIHLDAQ
jgi:hypothetical protein